MLLTTRSIYIAQAAPTSTFPVYRTNGIHSRSNQLSEWSESERDKTERESRVPVSREQGSTTILRKQLRPRTYLSGLRPTEPQHARHAAAARRCCRSETCLDWTGLFGPKKKRTNRLRSMFCGAVERGAWLLSRVLVARTSSAVLANAFLLQAMPIGTLKQPEASAEGRKS